MKTHKKFKFPTVGMRIIKTLLAIFLCFVLDSFWGVETPFYSAIAAIICMQHNLRDSFDSGMSRILGTIIGSIFGLILMLLLQPVLLSNTALLFYALITLTCLPLMYFMLLIKRPSAIPITCIVFLSVTVLHSDSPNVTSFAIERTLQTLEGVIIALLINLLPLKSVPESEE